MSTNTSTRFVCARRPVAPGARRHGDAANDGAPLPAAPSPLPLPKEACRSQAARARTAARPQARRDAPARRRQRTGTSPDRRPPSASEMLISGACPSGRRRQKRPLESNLGANLLWLQPPPRVQLLPGGLNVGLNRLSK